MEIVINKKLALTLSILYLIINILGISITFVILALIDNVNLSGEILINLFIVNMGSIISCFSGLIIAIGLSYLAGKFNLDKYTWFTVGLIFGMYSILLLLILIIIQNKKIQISLQKIIQIILLLLIVAYIMNLASNYFIGHFRDKIFFAKLMELNHSFVLEFSTYISTYPTIDKLLSLALNIIFAIKISNWVKNFSLKNRVVWITSTVIFGLFPVLLFHKLIIMEKINNNELIE